MTRTDERAADPRVSRADASGDTCRELRPALGPGRARIRLLHYPTDLAGATWADDLPAEVASYTEAIAAPLLPVDGGKRLTGAVYTSAGRLIKDSERGKTNSAWSGSADELVTLPGREAERIEGRTFFAGFHRHSFGHVLLEMVPRFWPDLDYSTYDTLLLYPQRSGRRRSELTLRPWARDLLAAAADGRLPPVRIVADVPLRLAEVTVSSPAFWLKRGFSPAARSAFDRVVRLAPPGPDAGSPRRIYLSRSRLTGPSRRADNEAELERLAMAAGCAVVHPQEHTVADQVTLIRGAEVIIGCDGSALHLAAVARPGTRLVALDSRPVPNQFLVDDLAALDAVHVLAVSGQGGHERTGWWHADVDRVTEALALAGLDRS